MNWVYRLRGLILGSAYLCLAGSLLRHSSRMEVWGLGALFLVAFLYRSWESGLFSVVLEAERGAIASGVGLGAWLMFKAWGFEEDEAFLRCLPLLSLCSWGLMVYGWQSLRLLSSGLVLFSFLAFPWEMIYGLCDLSLLTARFAHGVLNLLNLQGERVGTLIRLGTGSIEVYHGCSGLKMILQLVAFSLIYLVLNPGLGQQGFVLIFGAIAIGFSLNGIRVAMMAILVSLGDELAFAYWHLGTGSLVFSALGVLGLGLWGWQIKRCFDRYSVVKDVLK